MRLRNIPGAKDAIESSPYVIHEPKQNKGRWNEIFKNNHPIHIEVGMGKGRFLMDLASQNPDINYIGFEMYDSVLLRALQKMEERLPTYFLRVHRSYIVNLRKITEVSRLRIIFDKNTYIPVGDNYKERFSEHISKLSFS